ncbi:hypothetical protein [Aurantiacibacter aquimixticola]|uniref:Uncharacterized protein n=1 Tax=Aurantiacibacter aquimixticola TaxID=1958945 RepID=A0A419RNH2_9SPHN|nr:hypothetical protein [Aurantiacibacter aquimixticola]RJY06939.1 hypothetical protein D6201_12745 [Aurantiacibacter aquimixticola]
MKNNRRKARNRAAPKQTMSAQIEKPNIWSDWFPGLWIGPLSWIQMAALLMRDTKPEAIVDRLAPMLDSIREAIEAKCREWAKDAPDEPEFLITYDDYREHFLDELYEQFGGFLTTLKSNTDLEWLRDHLSDSGPSAESFVSFLLNGIATAQVEEQLDPERVAPDARWLAEIFFYEPAHTTGEEVVLREFYSKFRKTFERAAPLSERPWEQRSGDMPLASEDDPYIERQAAIEARQARRAAREHVPVPNEVDLPQDAWCRAMHTNTWARAIELTSFPRFGWQRQLAFMLRDVSLDEVVLRTERALLEMADLTDRNAIEDADARGKGPGEVRFGL